MSCAPLAQLVALVSAVGLASTASGQPLTWSLADGNENWPPDKRDAVTASITEAVALYNQYGYFDSHVTANYNEGVPTAEGNFYGGWITFGNSYNTRVALHEVGHTQGVGIYDRFNGGWSPEDGAANRLMAVFEGQGAMVSTGGLHFWPYGLNYDNEDGPAARERHVKILSALRFDLGVVVDSDGDSLPDDWEMHHFGKLAQGSDEDADSDSITNADEYATDTDPNHACPVVDGWVYSIRCQRDGGALRVVDDRQDDGATIVLGSDASSTFAHFRAEYVGSGYFRFVNVGSGKALTIEGTDVSSGRALSQVSVADAYNQHWRIARGIGAAEDHYMIASRQTGRLVDGTTGAEGVDVQQWPYGGNIDQQYWRFETVTGPEPQTPSTGGTDGVLDGGLGGGPSPPAGGAVSGILTGGIGTGGNGGSPTGGTAPSPASGGAPGTTGGVTTTTTDTSSGCSCAIHRTAPASNRKALALLFVAAAITVRARRRRAAVRT